MLRFSIAGSSMAALHLTLLGYTVFLIVSGAEPQWPVYWTWFLALDFPLSLGVVPLAWIFPPAPAGPLHDFANFWWPLGYHGMIGSAWWYIVGMYLGRKLAPLRDRMTRKNKARR